jgi:hypothetical protein
MKKLAYIGFVSFLFVASLTMTACSSSSDMVEDDTTSMMSLGSRGVSQTLAE